MSFFVPGSWNSALPGSISQPLQVGAGIATAGTIASRYLPKMPGFRKKYNYISRNNKRQRIGKFSRAARRLSSRKRVSSGQGVTEQHDTRRVYRRRRMPRRKRRRWVRFSNKVAAVSEKRLGTRIVVFNKQTQHTNAVANEQGNISYSLYSARGTGSTFHDDLRHIVNNENTGDQTAAAGNTIYQSSKFIFKSGVLDLTVRNTSYLGNDTSVLSGTLEVDAYEIITRQTASNSGNNFSSLEAIFADASGDVGTIGGAGTTLTIIRRGSTPFEIPYASSRYGVRVLKKTKYFLPPNGLFTYQIRDPKRHVWTKEKLNEYQGASIPYVTKWVFFIFKASPGTTLGTAAGQLTEALTVGATRKYTYKVTGVNEMRDEYFNR